MKKQAKISSGLYLVIDPSKDEKELLVALGKALEAGPCAVQIWDNFTSVGTVSALICKIKVICKASKVPLFINNHPEWLELFDLDGIHFDGLAEVSQDCLIAFHKQNKIVGVTVNNDLDLIERAITLGMDYLSFCSIFPSSTSTSCELVEFDTIRKTRKLTDVPIFLAGGINPENIDQLQSLDFDGIAAVSGVMSASDPAAAILNYKQSLTNLNK